MSKVNKVAILIDGGFFIQRFKHLKKDEPTRKDVEELIKQVMATLQEKSGGDSIDILYRTYYYDCLPYAKEIKDLQKKSIDCSASPVYAKQMTFIDSLKDIDQFALRLGELSFSGWKIPLTSRPNPKPVPNFNQKGVDMKMGLDMAWMAGKNTVGKIVLIAGDSDFISPIKFVRREGILVYLFPMGNHIKRELREHSDFVLDLK